MKATPANCSYKFFFPSGALPDRSTGQALQKSVSNYKTNAHRQERKLEKKTACYAFEYVSSSARFVGDTILDPYFYDLRKIRKIRKLVRLPILHRFGRLDGCRLHRGERISDGSDPTQPLFSCRRLRECTLSSWYAMK